MTHRRKTLNHEFLGDSFAEARRLLKNKKKKKRKKANGKKKDKGKKETSPRGISSFDGIVETVENDCLRATCRMTDRKLIPANVHAYFPYLRKQRNASKSRAKLLLPRDKEREECTLATSITYASVTRMWSTTRKMRLELSNVRAARVQFYCILKKNKIISYLTIKCAIK